jgi:hypothetical protein
MASPLAFPSPKLYLYRISDVKNVRRKRQMSNKIQIFM